MVEKKFIYSSILIGFILSACYAQVVQVKIVDNQENKTLYSANVKVVSDIHKVTKEFLYNYQRKGYLLADYDSIIKKDSVWIYYLNKHNLFKWAQLRKGNLENKLYYEFFQSKKFDQKPVIYSEIVNLFEKIIRYYENNGYPFASIKLDSISIDSNYISASLLINKYQYVKIDSIILQGSLKINKKFLYKYIDIYPNNPYSEKKLQQIENKLKKLPFVTIRQSPIIRITDKYNKVYIFADHKNVSQFDGIIGIQPDANGKTILAGNLKIKLINSIFRNAEQIDLDWQRVQALTQNFKFYYSMPYLFGTPFGLNYHIQLFKKDSTFIDVQNQIGINYYFSGINHIQFFYKLRNSNLISTYGLSNISVLPDYADVTTKNYGIGCGINTLNNINNPSKGWVFQTQVSVGNKTIRKNPAINEQVYKNILLNSLQYQAEGNIDVFIPRVLSKYTTLKLSTKWGYIDGNGILFKNELFRIGGLKSIRGFNEQSIFANTYLIPSVEYRFIYSENGYLMIFSDVGYYTANFNNQKQSNQIYSFGAGIQFETKAGLFNLIYALGNNFGQSPDFRIGKIHAGLIANF